MALNVELITEAAAVEDTTPPTLSSIRSDPAGQTSLSWSADVSEDGATVFARARLASSPELSKSEIQNGNGNARGSLGQSVSAAGSSSGQITGLTAATSYVVDMFGRDAAGNESPTVYSAPATSTAVPGGSITVSINMMDQSALGIAPEGVFLEARITNADVTEDLNRLNYDPSFHRTRVRWTFTKQGEAYTAQASDKGRNLPAVFNDTNTAYGKRVGHVFTDPGTWVIDVEVTDFSGNVGSAQTTHTVLDPDAVFTGNRTICVGSGDQATYPGSQTVANLPAAITAMQNLGQTGRILLERGATYNEQQLSLLNSASNWYIGAYGSGARPIIFGAGRATGGQSILTNYTDNKDVQFTGIKMQGAWDATTETGDIIKGYRRPPDDGNTRYYELFNDCVFESLEIGIDFGKQDNGLNSTQFSGEYVHNCDFPEYQDMQIFHASAPMSYLSVTGTVLRQDENAMMGQNGKYGSPRYNQHTPHRAAHAGYCYYAANEFFSRNNWTTNSKPSTQSALRWNTGRKPGASAVVERNYLEGGRACINLEDAESATDRSPDNLLVERNLMVMAADSRYFVISDTNGLTFRNNLCINPNVPRLKTGQDDGLSFTPGGLSSPSVPNEVYSNTIVHLKTNANVLVAGWDGGDSGILQLRGVVDIDLLQNYVDENNILYCPNASGAQVASEAVSTGLDSTPFVTVAGSYDSYYLGVKFQPNFMTMQTDWATPNGDIQVYSPTPSGPFDGTATGIVAIDDFWGNLRTGSPNPGAI